MPLRTLTTRLGLPGGGGLPLTVLGSGTIHSPPLPPVGQPSLPFRAFPGSTAVQDLSEESWVSQRSPSAMKFQWSPLLKTWLGKQVPLP